MDLRDGFEAARTRPLPVPADLAARARQRATRREVGRRATAAVAVVVVGVAGLGAVAARHEQPRTFALSLTDPTSSSAPLVPTDTSTWGPAGVTVAGVARTPSRGCSNAVDSCLATKVGVTPDGTTWETAGLSVLVRAAGWTAWPALDPSTVPLPGDAQPYRAVVVSARAAVVLLASGTTVYLARTYDTGSHWTVQRMPSFRTEILPTNNPTQAGAARGSFTVQPLLDGTNLLGLVASDERTQDPTGLGLLALTPDGTELRATPTTSEHVVASDGVLWTAFDGVLARSPDDGRTWLPTPIDSALGIAGPAYGGGVYLESGNPVQTIERADSGGELHVIGTASSSSFLVSTSVGIAAVVGDQLTVLDPFSGLVTTTTASGLLDVTSLRALTGTTGIAVTSHADGSASSTVVTTDGGRTWTTTDPFA